MIYRAAVAVNPAIIVLAATVAWSAGTNQAPESAKILLAEVLFDPAGSDSAFVELANVGDRPVDLSSMVLRIDTVYLPLPRLASPFAPGTRVLIRFDGRAVTEANVVHASSTFGLQARGGVVSLRWNDDRVIDQMAWGDAPGAFVPTIGGLAIVQLQRGSSFGRPPGANQAGARSDWVVYAPEQVTPGQSNSLPPVEQLMPANGAILEETSVDLTWYPVPGAVRYRVQLAADTAFARTLVNQVVTELTASTGQLSAGVYWWRVQAIPGEGPAAAWSTTQRIELGPARGGGGGTRGGGRSAPDAFDDAAFNERVTSAPVMLNVPLLLQHKDSKMLHLESLQEGRQRTNGFLPRVPHAWDRDHGTLDRSDPADSHNCTLASLAMVNRFYGGDLSQDRIGYEGWSRNVTKYRSSIQNPAVVALVRRLFAGNAADLQEALPGPERDLHLGQGMPWARLMAAGLFALGALPGDNSGALAPFGSLTRDDFWKAIMIEIDAGRPVMAHYPGHAIVVRGYELRGVRRLVYINDPFYGRYALDLDAPTPPPMGKSIIMIWTYPNHPAVAHQEPEVSKDTDGDGVFDFDETERFRTNPNNQDTDRDGVRDKQDIASGIYESEFGLGYAFTPGPNSPGRDFDFDGSPTELDPDSDGGGCKDGEEDLNGDGERTGAELANFDQTDDVCGTLEGNVSYAIDAVNTDPNNLAKEISDQGVILVKLKPQSPGSATYVDAGSTFSYQGHARMEIPVGPNCVMWGREMSRGAGPFTGGNAEIGGSRGDDGTLALGATAGVPAESWAGGCGPGGATQAERTMSFPDCTGRLAPSRAGQQGSKTYAFACTTKPDLGPGWTVTRFYARGFIRVR
jgi:hypothetical protein